MNQSPSLERRLLTTGGARLAVLPVSTVVALVMHAVLIRDLGEAQYGVLSLLITIPQLLPFLDLGLGTGLVNAYAGPDRPTAVRQTITAWFMLCMVAAVLLLVVVVVHLSVGWSAVLGVDLSFYPPVMLLLYAAMFLIAVPIGLGQRILVGLGRVTLVTWLQGLFAPINLAVVGVGHLTGQFEVYLLTNVLAQLMVAICILVVATRAVGIRATDLVTPTRGQAVDRRLLWASAAPMLLISICLPLTFQSHRLVLSHLAPDGLTPYAVAMVLYAPAVGLLNQVGMNLWSHFTRIATDDPDATQQAFWKLLRLSVPANLLFAVGFAVAAPVVSELWSGQRLSPWLWVAMGTLLFVQGIQYVPGMYLTTPAGLRFQARCVVAMTGLAFGLMWVVTPVLGTTGPVIASVIGVAVCQLSPELVHIARGRR